MKTRRVRSSEKFFQPNVLVRVKGAILGIEYLKGAWGVAEFVLGLS